MADEPRWTSEVTPIQLGPITPEMISAVSDAMLNAPPMRPLYNRRLYERFGLLEVIAWERVTPPSDLKETPPHG